MLRLTVWERLLLGEVGRGMRRLGGVGRGRVAVAETVRLTAEATLSLPAEASSPTSVHPTAHRTLPVHRSSSTVLPASCSSSSIGKGLGLNEVEDSIGESELDDGLFRHLLAGMLGRRRVLANAEEGRRHNGESTAVLASCSEG